MFKLTRITRKFESFAYPYFLLNIFNNNTQRLSEKNIYRGRLDKMRPRELNLLKIFFFKIVSNRHLRLLSLLFYIFFWRSSVLPSKEENFFSGNWKFSLITSNLSKKKEVSLCWNAQKNSWFFWRDCFARLPPQYIFYVCSFSF